MPKSTTRHNDDPTEDNQQSRGATNAPSNTRARAATSGDNAGTTESLNGSAHASARRRRSSANVQPLNLLEDDPSAYDSGIEVGRPGDRDFSTVDDLDSAERFDLGETRYRGNSRAGDTIVDAIDEAYDTLGLNDEEVIPSKLDRPSTTKRNGRSAPIEPAALLEAVIEVEILEIEVEVTEDLEESEPDAAELARAATEVEVVEVEQPEELERFIDRVLSMESVSVDDPVRIYLREIGRTALLKSPDESALAEKMTLGRKAREDMESLEGNRQYGLVT
jgi:hypothetical protein